jgi:hypothetical protein
MADFLPFLLTNDQTVYLNPDHIVSIRFNGGFYSVTVTETTAEANGAGMLSTIANRVYEAKEIPFELE